MQKENITDNLEKLLMAIHRQVVAIRDADGEQIPKIEMDKALSNIRALYEQFTVLNYLNTYPRLKAQTEGAVPSGSIKAEIAQNPESIFEPIIEKKVDTIPIIPAEPVHTVIPENIISQPVQPMVRKQPEDVKIQPTAEHQIPKHIEPEILKEAHIDPPKPVTPYLSEDEKYMPRTSASAESISRNTGTDSQRLADKLRFQKLEDIHKAVTLSDKFLYMNELFEGENNSYKEAVDMLNRLSSQAEAEQYMNSLSARYGWADKPKTEKKFRELVSRKFV